MEIRLLKDVLGEKLPDKIPDTLLNQCIQFQWSSKNSAVNGLDSSMGATGVKCQTVQD